MARSNRRTDTWVPQAAQLDDLSPADLLERIAQLYEQQRTSTDDTELAGHIAKLERELEQIRVLQHELDRLRTGK